MTKTIGETKRSAKVALSGNYGKALLVSLIPAMIAGGLGFGSNFFSGFLRIFEETAAEAEYVSDAEAAAILLGSLGLIMVIWIIAVAVSFVMTVLQSNLLTGTAKFYLNMATGNSNFGFSNLFSQFARGFMKPFALDLIMGLKITLWFMIGYIPGVIMVIPAVLFFQNSYNLLGGICIFIAVVLILVGLILAVIASLRYSMAYFALAENRDFGPLDAIRHSKELMSGNKANYVLLNLSFIGWILLSCLTFGVGFIFLEPYLNATITVFYCDISGKAVVGDMAYYSAQREFEKAEPPVSAEPEIAPEKPKEPENPDPTDNSEQNN